MGFIKRFRPSPALVVSVITLFVAMSGLAVASFKLKPNSVKTKNVRNGAITQEKIADGAVSSSKLAAGSVTAGKVAMSFTVTFNGASVPGSACVTESASAPGVRATDNVIVSPPQIPAGLTPEWYATDDHMVVGWCNLAGSLAVLHGSTTWRVLVIR